MNENDKMKAFLIDLREVLTKHNAGLTYTTDDNGIHAVLENEQVCIGFNGGSNYDDIKSIILQYI